MSRESGSSSSSSGIESLLTFLSLYLLVAQAIAWQQQHAVGGAQRSVTGLLAVEQRDERAVGQAILPRRVAETAIDHLSQGRAFFGRDLVDGPYVQDRIAQQACETPLLSGHFGVVLQLELVDILLVMLHRRFNAAFHVSFVDGPQRTDDRRWTLPCPALIRWAGDDRLTSKAFRQMERRGIGKSCGKEQASGFQIVDLHKLTGQVA